MKKPHFLILFLVCSLSSFGQEADSCITIKTEKDAFVLNRPDALNNNYGAYQDLIATAWTNMGDLSVTRSLIHFDWTLPNGATINTAKISLYHHTSPHGNSDHSGANETYIQRITSAWDEMVVTWNTQPTTTATNQVSLPASTSATQDYIDIDITQIIQDIYISGDNNGIMLMLQSEAIYKSLLFSSREDTDTSLHAKLEICYTNEPVGLDEELAAPQIQLFPNPTESEFTLKGNDLTSVKIYNSLGAEVYSEKISSNSTAIKLDAASGIYQVVVTDKNGAISRLKLVKE